MRVTNHLLHPGMILQVVNPSRILRHRPELFVCLALIWRVLDKSFRVTKNARNPEPKMQAFLSFPLHKPYPYSSYRWRFLHFRYLKLLMNRAEILRAQNKKNPRDFSNAQALVCFCCLAEFRRVATFFEKDGKTIGGSVSGSNFNVCMGWFFNTISGLILTRIITLFSRWWCQIFFIFTPIWGRFPFWLVFFGWVETAN